jgi:hypothetical protein
VPLHRGWLEKQEFEIISVMKLKVQYITAESLCLARAQRMNLNTVGTLFNVLEKAANKTLSDTLRTFPKFIKVANK